MAAPPELARYAGLAIGVFQILANGVLLFRGFSRLPAELQKEGASARIADLLRAAWAYGMLGNLCVGLLLVAIAPAVGAGEPLARRIAGVIGLYYVVVGLVAYASALNRHRGFLVFSLLGAALLLALWLSGHDGSAAG